VTLAPVIVVVVIIIIIVVVVGEEGEVCSVVRSREGPVEDTDL
jgi:hypothetical protein